MLTSNTKKNRVVDLAIIFCGCFRNYSAGGLMLVWRSCSGEENQHETKRDFYRFTNVYQRILRPTSNFNWSFLSNTDTSCTILLINDFTLLCEETDMSNWVDNATALPSFCGCVHCLHLYVSLFTRTKD